MATIELERITSSLKLRYDVSTNLLPECEWTNDRLTEELYLCLMKSPNTDYQKKAFDLIYKIPVYRPTPCFEIKISDLSASVKRELDLIWTHKRELDFILKQAVSRIFANVNERYFLLSVKHLLQVRLIP
jgi:hypothetical protein